MIILAAPAPLIYPIETGHIATAAGARFNLTLLATFAGIALALAATGVYGMVAFDVAERRREIAVRLTLGASGTRVAREILWTGLALTSVGLVVGAGASIAAAHVLASFYGGRPNDPLTFAAGVVLLSAAIVACLAPARQAIRLDAVRVLRE